MLPELTTEQAAKLARLWQWREGHRTYRTRLRVVEIDEEGEIYFSRNDNSGYKPGELMPDLDDDTTRDGLLRTARAAWQNPRLHAQPLWDFDEPDKIARWDIHGAPRCAGKTEEAALLAAILAAPEAT